MTPASAQDAFRERVQIILDEQLLGMQWGRPSLIMAVTRSQQTRGNVQAMLAGSLNAGGIPVLHYQVDKGHYYIPGDLCSHPRHEQVVFFVTGLHRGGGRGYSNAYRALNMHREYLVEGCIKAVFWLTEMEARETARFSPDFWAFRHRVIEFLDLPHLKPGAEKEPQPLPLHGLASSRSKVLQTQLSAAEKWIALGCTEAAQTDLRRILRAYPGEIAILLRIAELHLLDGQTSDTRRVLRQASHTGRMTQRLKAEYDRLDRAVRSLPPPSGGILEGMN